MQSHKTAISRSSLSVPMRAVLEADSMGGKVLDYGCGKGTCADRIGADKFDPYYFPEPPAGQYDTITCMYVLNVIPGATDRLAVVNSIKALLAPGGTAYIAVRADRFKEGYTSKGWQGYVDVPGCELILERKGSFKLYRFENVTGS
jgi:2-polyprenyl-3-methyl-5-hydroxy-6-metoxy-1,4-benzoquinol methylase